MSADLKALIERLEAAEGPSRELDGLIFRAINPDVPEDDWTTFHDDVWCMRDPEDAIAFIVPSEFTASIDASIPGESIRRVERHRYPNGATVWRATHDGLGMALGFMAEAATEPLARRIAALRAKLTETDK